MKAAAVVSLVLVAALAVVAGALLAPRPGPVVAQQAPTVFEAPAPGGWVMGVAGTSSPAALAAAQRFDVASIEMRDPATGLYLVYYPASPQSSTLTSVHLTPASIVVVRRAGPPPAPSPTASPTPAPSLTATPAPAPTPRPASTATPAPAVPASPPPPAGTMADLATLVPAIEEAIRVYSPGGRVSIAVTDLQTGETAGVRQTSYHYSGCVMNLFLLMQVVLDVQDGKLTMAQVDNLIRRTTWSSNPMTARDLYALLGDGDTLAGVERVDELIRERLGLRNVVINHVPGYQWQGGIGRGTENWVTAADVNEALAMLWRGEILDEAHTAYLLEVLATVSTGLNYLTAAVPGRAVVSHKNGFFPYALGYVDNDAGIVRFERGGETYAYAITMMIEAIPRKYAHIPMGQRISAVTWQWFAEAYP